MNCTAPTIVHRQANGYHITMLDDGTDYWAALEALLPALEKDSRGFRNRQVGIGQYGDRMYVVKRDITQITHIECKLSRWWHGPVFSKIMRETTRAVAEGCDIVQQVYLVAERMKRGLATESLILLEFVPGHSIPKKKYFEYGARVAEAIQTLHRYRLASMDPNPGNFIISGDQPLRVIDLSFRDSFLMGRAKDYVYIKKTYGIDLPNTGLLNRFLIAAVRVNRYLRTLSRLLRGHPVETCKTYDDPTLPDEQSSINEGNHESRPQ